MTKNELFRVALIGGYNKADVQEYIKTLENEIESIKVLHEKEKNELVRQLGRNGSIVTAGEETAGLREELRQKTEELRAKEEELQTKEEELQTKEEELQSVQLELARMEEELQGAELTKRLADQEQDFLDQNTIAKVMEDARRNAKLIQEEAEREREEILEKAGKEAEQLKAELAAKVSSELEEKGIQLIAAKYKIAQYMKEVKSAQEGLHTVYSRMNHIVENMPARLDNYWDGEHYRILEDSLKEENGEPDEEKSGISEEKEG